MPLEPRFPKLSLAIRSNSQIGLQKTKQANVNPFPSQALRMRSWKRLACPPVSRGNSPCRRLHETCARRFAASSPKASAGGGAPIGSTNGARADLSHPPPIDPHKFDIGAHASKRRRLPITRAALPSRQFQARRDQAARDPQTKNRGEPGRQTCGPVTEMSHLTYKIPTISSEEANRD